jgi:hypothetical protein
VAATPSTFEFAARGEVMEISLLNSGMMFDLELYLAWKGLTGRELGDIEQLQMYIIEYVICMVNKIYYVALLMPVNYHRLGRW